MNLISTLLILLSATTSQNAIVATSTVLTKEETNKVIIITLAKKYGLPEQTMLDIAKCESAFREEDENKETHPDGKQISSAEGLFMITSPTWSDFKCIGDKKDAFDSTMCAMKIATHTKGFSRWDASRHCWNKPPSEP